MAYSENTASSTKRERRKRAPRMTIAQANHLANFMLRNKEFAVRTPASESGEKKKTEIWKRLALELNSLSGPSKKIDGWKKTWLDLKRTSRLRVTKHLKDKGTSEVDKCTISDLDRRVLEAMGIAIKIGEPSSIVGNDDEMLTFVEVKESDDSNDFLGADGNEEQVQGDNYNEDEDIKDGSFTRMHSSRRGSNYVSVKKCKRSSSCSEELNASSSSEESHSGYRTRQVAANKGRNTRHKKKVKKKKSGTFEMERVLRDLQDDYASGLKAIADAINKIADIRNIGVQNYNPKPKRITQPWFQYLKFDS